MVSGISMLPSTPMGVDNNVLDSSGAYSHSAIYLRKEREKEKKKKRKVKDISVDQG